MEEGVEGIRRNPLRVRADESRGYRFNDKLKLICRDGASHQPEPMRRRGSAVHGLVKLLYPTSFERRFQLSSYIEGRRLTTNIPVQPTVRLVETDFLTRHVVPALTA